MLGCTHVKKIPGESQRVKIHHVPGEDEYLFVPYSVFTVTRVVWAEGTPENPHKIELEAAKDNAVEKEDLPLAPWA